MNNPEGWLNDQWLDKMYQRNSFNYCLSFSIPTLCRCSLITGGPKTIKSLGGKKNINWEKSILRPTVCCFASHGHFPKSPGCYVGGCLVKYHNSLTHCIFVWDMLE